ncbi:MAG: hypothetical protein AB8F74_03785 [Saprospiraceae bacterium]
MFSKLRDIAKFAKKDKDLINLASLKGELCEGLFSVMEESFEQRKNDLQNSNFKQADIDKIIAGYSQKNMILAAATSIVPGPFGILGSIPELMLNFKNQMDMIYDLGCANGKENFINKDVLLDIPFAAFGGNTNLSQLQGNASDLMDSPKELLLGKATQLAESVVERTLKKSIIQFIPVAGPILMGTWAKVATSKISNNTVTFLDNSQLYIEHLKPEETEEIKKELMKEKIKAMANLIESNDDINEDQIELIGTIIENANLTTDEKAYFLEEALKAGSNFQLNYQLLIDYEEAEPLIMGLVVIAKRSGHTDEFEKAFIYREADKLDISKNFVDELLQ